MKPVRVPLAVAATTLALAIAAAPARADKCTGAKLKAVGKKESGLLGCQSKVAKTGDSSGLSACEQKVSGKFSVAFGKAGSCAGDQMRCEDIADSCESSVAGAFIDTLPSKCEAAKRKAAGKLASAQLGCYAKAAKKALPVDSTCITKATGKFSTALTKAGACPDGGSPQSLVEDHCVTVAVTTNGGGTVTDVCPTTTTTSTTTTSTTTTTVVCTNIQPDLQPPSTVLFAGTQLIDASGSTSSCNSLQDLRFFWSCSSLDSANCSAFIAAVNVDGNTHPSGDINLVAGNTYIITLVVCSAVPPPPAICAPSIQAQYTVIEF